MSAFEPHVIAVDFVGMNSGLTGAMNQVSGGLTNLGRQQQQFGRQAGQTFGYWSQQMRIMRRSAEYMLAGFASYKVIQAFQNYKQFRSELGTLNTNLNVGQSELNQWGKAAIDVSNRTATPVDQVVQSFQNLAASFPDLHASARRYLFPAMAEIEAKAANILGSSVQPQQFGSTILQAARSFYGAQRVESSVRRDPRGRNLLEQLTGQVITTLHQVPGTSGQALVSYLPTLFQGAKSGGFTPEQTLAMFTVAQRVMGRPAQTMQYLRQLQFRLKRPTPAAGQFLQQSGIIQNQQQLYSMSGWDILQRILHHAARLPGGVSQQQLKQMAASGNLQGVHLTGEAGQFLTQALGGKTGAGRMQSLFALQALSTGLPDLSKEVNRLTHHSQDLNHMFGQWLSQNQLTQASNQLSNFSLTLINSFSPLINTLAKTAGHLAKWSTDVVRYASRGLGFVNRHTGGALGYASDFGLAYALRAGLPPGLGNAVGRIPGVGRLLKPLFQMTQGEKGLFGRVLGRGAGAAGTDLTESTVGPGILSKAFSTAISGPLDISAMSSALGGQANGTPVAPFWVVIHPLSKATVPGLFGMGPNSPSGLVPKTVTEAENLGKKIAVKVASTAASGLGIEEAVSRGALFRRAFRYIRRGGSDVPKLADIGEGASWAARMAEFLGRGAVFASPNMVGTSRAFRLPNGKMATVADLGGKRPTITGLNKNSLAYHFLSAVGTQIPRGLGPVISGDIAGTISDARARRDIQRYYTRNLRKGLSHQMTAGQASSFYKYIDPIFNLGNRDHFIHRATQTGGYMQGFTDVTVSVEPTQELKNLIKPSHRKVHVRAPITNAPTQRGGKPTNRNH